MISKRKPILAMLAICLASNIVVFAITGEPKIYVVPDHAPVNSVVNIHITIDTTKGPSGYNFLYAEIDQLSVSYPPWNEGAKYAFMLGTATAPSIAGQKITVHIGDDFVLPFGPGVGAITVDGQVYWWWITLENGNPVSPSTRLDAWGQSPTQWKGKYAVDMGGWAYYQETGGQHLERQFYFDTWITFTVPELAIAMAALLGYMAVSMRKKAKKNQ